MNRELAKLACGFLSLTQDGKILEVNDTLLQWLNYGQKDLQGQHVDSILSPSSKLFYQIYFFPLIKMHGKVEEVYLSLLSSDELEVPVLINGLRHPHDGKIVNDFIIIKITNRHKLEHELLIAKKEAEEANRLKDQAIADLEIAKKNLEEMNHQLATLATTDALTGLKNRRSFQEFLEFNLSQFTRLSLLLIDIDHFKKVNDTWGHSMGDLVLQMVSQILKTSFRANDLVARYGGEEFAVILPGADRDEAVLAAERLRIKVENASCAEVKVTVSIGATTFLKGDNSNTVLNRADKALYQSKNEGRNKVTHFTKS